MRVGPIVSEAKVSKGFSSPTVRGYKIPKALYGIGMNGSVEGVSQRNVQEENIRNRVIGNVVTRRKKVFEDFKEVGRVTA